VTFLLNGHDRPELTSVIIILYACTLFCVFEGVTTRIIGQTFNLTCSPDYKRWLENTRQNWLPLLPTFDLLSQDLTSSQDSHPSQTDPTQSIFNPQPTSSDMSISTNDSQTLADISNRNVSQQQSQVPDPFLQSDSNSVLVNSRPATRRIRSPRSSRSRSPMDRRPSQRSRITYAASVSSHFPPHPRIDPSPPPPPQSHIAPLPLPLPPDDLNLVLPLNESCIIFIPDYFSILVLV
jgi:hypothetical protein